jgi:asparagine synthase (glutamine-hydrolysing)
VAALVAEDRPIKSFSVAFETGGFYDERFYARLVAKRLKTEHTEIVVTAQQFRESLPDVIRMLDEPVMDLAALPLYFLSKATREQVKVVLSGEGSDEVLGGYNFNRIAFQLACLKGFQKIPKGLRDAVRTVSRGRAKDLLAQLSWPTDRFPAMKGMHITNIFGDAERAALLVNPQGLYSPRRHVDAAYAKVAHADPINQMLAVYSGGWLSEDLLMKADKMTMAHGLELRVPFLDYRLVEFLFGLPGEAKVQGPRTTGTKLMLRRAMKGRLPGSVLTRDKRGFPVPLAEWVRSEPRWFEELLGRRAGVGGMFRRESLTGLMKRARAGEHVWQRVWNLSGLWLWDEQMRGLSSQARQLRAKEAA